MKRAPTLITATVAAVDVCKDLGLIAILPHDMCIAVLLAGHFGVKRELVQVSSKRAAVSCVAVESDAVGIHEVDHETLAPAVLIDLAIEIVVIFCVDAEE